MPARPIRILGLSCYYHDSAAALIEDGRIVAAAQEERFTRIKGDAAFPHQAVACCLDAAGITEQDIDHIVFYENPVAKFERLLTTYHLTAPFSLRSFLRAFPSWLTGKIWLENEIARELGVRKRVVFCDHHLSHAASAFFPSPFERAAVLTIDGVGEWSTTAWGTAEGNRITLSEQLRFPNSWGLLYSAFTAYTGFKINSGEYKLMGLAPYGRPIYADLILDKLIRLGDDGSVVLNQDYFDYAGGLRMTNARFHALFGGPPRPPESLVTQREMDLAASIQSVINEALLRLARQVQARTGEEHLVLAGGVALNVVATGKLSEAGIFKEIWIQPAAGDAGGALGAALWMWFQKLGHARAPEKPDAMQGSFLGTDIPPVSADDDAVLQRLDAVWENLGDTALQERIAAAVGDGKVVAVARGRMEFGPRALGARSILADARSPRMQSHLNLKIKFREGFRPFAPMVLAEAAADWFDVRQSSPYMLLVSPVRESRRLKADDQGLSGIDLLKVPRSTIPAVTHVDYSARVQSIDAQRHPFMRGVLERFAAATGCPVMVNTSFNVRGEPIVNSAEDAYRCFMATEIDCLVVGNRWLERDRQKNCPLNETERARWLQRFELD
ncbi:MAG TPA: carbamoyltransferase N-terminal domain-containing protein [Opitutaceae bacterium]|nr:carbamoyltransferase N-terminal domain-containing protein [Opitutaceae bacterium]